MFSAASGKKKVLLLSPHADDIEIGAGGSLSRLLREGHEIRWVMVATPEKERELEFSEVLDSLSIGQCEIYGFRDRYLEANRQDILDRLDATRDDFRPDLVIGPPRDLHQDHCTVHNEMLRAFKTSASILCYEPWQSESFSPQLYVRLHERDLDQKSTMIKSYVTQSKKAYTDSRYLRSRALLRGAQCGAEFAEAFEVLRWML